MWKSILGISLTVCVLAISATAEDKGSKPSVLVKCCGKLRHGIVAIGGETTGTTLTFDRITWELQLQDEAVRRFAKEHHKEPVVAIGALRRVQGIEKKVRWIVDVETLKICDSKKDEEGALLRIQGILQASEPHQGMTLVADGYAWPVDFSTVPNVQPMVNSLIGEPVVVVGRLNQVASKVHDTPKSIIRVKTLKQPPE